MLRNKIFGNSLPNKMLFQNVLRNVLRKVLSKRVVVLVLLRVVLVHAVKARDRPAGSNKRNILLNGDDPRRTVVVPLGVAARFDEGDRRGNLDRNVAKPGVIVRVLTRILMSWSAQLKEPCVSDESFMSGRRVAVSVWRRKSVTAREAVQRLMLVRHGPGHYIAVDSAGCAWTQGLWHKQLTLPPSPGLPEFFFPFTVFLLDAVFIPSQWLVYIVSEKKKFN